MLIEPSRDYEKPETGTFLATVIDVIDLGKVKTQFGEKVKVRIVWVLNASDSEGTPFRVIRQVNASINEKAALYEIAKGILGTAPPVPFDSELLIGRSNQLVVVKETDAKGKAFANVKVILPLPAGAVPPPIPAGFVRDKDRTKTTQTAAPQVVGVASSTATTQTSQATAYGTVASAPAPQPIADTAF